MEIKSLKRARKFKKEIRTQIVKEVGTPKTSLESQIAKESSHTEFEEETSILNKLRQAIDCLEKAQEEIDSIETSLHEKKLEKYKENRKYSELDNYEEDSKVRMSDKTYKSLRDFLETLETGETQNNFLEYPEKIEEDTLNREEIVGKLLFSAKLVSRAATILEKKDKPAIKEKNYSKMFNIADEIKEDEISLLRAARETKYNLSVAQKYMSKLENE